MTQIKLLLILALAVAALTWKFWYKGGVGWKFWKGKNKSDDAHGEHGHKEKGTLFLSLLKFVGILCLAGVVIPPVWGIGVIGTASIFGWHLNEVRKQNVAEEAPENCNFVMKHSSQEWGPWALDHQINLHSEKDALGISSLSWSYEIPGNKVVSWVWKRGQEGISSTGLDDRQNFILQPNSNGDFLGWYDEKVDGRVSRKYFKLERRGLK